MSMQISNMFNEFIENHKYFREMSQYRSPEKGYGNDHMDLSVNTDLLGKSYDSSNPYNVTSQTSSSKAVMDVLRALQQKIRKLEYERSQALDESVQLRNQLKNQEVEAEHARQREQLTAQKSLHDVRGAYERLLSDKSELEVRLSKFEEKNKQAQNHVDELQTKIRVLEDEKHAGTMKLKDLEHQRNQIEAQIKSAQQKEEELAQSMTWEAKRHDETVSFNQKRIQSLQDELSELCEEKGMSDAKLMELDQLVGQLLNINNALVTQLTGKSVKNEIKMKTKKVKNPKIPRVASLSTASVDASKVTKFSRKGNSQLIPVDNEDVEALKNMHNMYSKIAKSIKKSISPIRGGGKKTTSSISASSMKGKSNTRLSRKKAELMEQFNQEARNSLEHGQRLSASAPASYSASVGEFGTSSHNSSYTPRSSVEVRLPKPSVYEGPADTSTDYDENYPRSSGGLQSSFLSHSTAGPGSHAPHVSFTHGEMSPVLGAGPYHPTSQYTRGTTATTSTTPSRQPQPHNQADMQNVISALEEEFDQLNFEYRRLLNNVQTGETTGTSNNTSSDFIRPSTGGAIPTTTQESVEKQAGDLVAVIQKLHKKGEQLRALKSSP